MADDLLREVELAEAGVTERDIDLVEVAVFNPRLHPRGRAGQFVDVLGKLAATKPPGVRSSEHVGSSEREGKKRLAAVKATGGMGSGKERTFPSQQVGDIVSAHLEVHPYGTHHNLRVVGAHPDYTVTVQRPNGDKHRIPANWARVTTPARYAEKGMESGGKVEAGMKFIVSGGPHAGGVATVTGETTPGGLHKVRFSNGSVVAMRAEIVSKAVRERPAPLSPSYAHGMGSSDGMGSGGHVSIKVTLSHFTNPNGVRVHQVMANGMPVTAETEDEARAAASARKVVNDYTQGKVAGAGQKRVSFEEWDGDKGAHVQEPTVIEPGGELGMGSGFEGYSAEARADAARRSVVARAREERAGREAGSHPAPGVREGTRVHLGMGTFRDFSSEDKAKAFVERVKAAGPAGIVGGVVTAVPGGGMASGGSTAGNPAKHPDPAINKLYRERRKAAEAADGSGVKASRAWVRLEQIESELRKLDPEGDWRHEGNSYDGQGWQVRRDGGMGSGKGMASGRSGVTVGDLLAQKESSGETTTQWAQRVSEQARKERAVLDEIASLRKELAAIHDDGSDGAIFDARSIAMRIEALVSGSGMGSGGRDASYPEQSMAQTQAMRREIARLGTPVREEKRADGVRRLHWRIGTRTIQRDVAPSGAVSDVNRKRAEHVAEIEKRVASPAHRYATSKHGSKMSRRSGHDLLIESAVAARVEAAAAGDSDAFVAAFARERSLRCA